ncbi:hypothetical protein ACFW2V_42270 [Streptomyces sp. NPDC058947]|uniref:Secreted protein n=1 Tax=Streptomyces levis TaxID=285566 RepID=A0ABN3NEK7_9ACTN
MHRTPTPRRLLRTACVTGAAALAGLVAAPQAGAATPEAAPASCTTATDTRSFGRGEITVCVGDDGTARVTGWVEDLLPGGGLGGPDGGCVGWWITWQTAGGQELDLSPFVCGHFHNPDRLDFDYDPTTREGGPRNVTGVTQVKLGTVWI